MRLRRASGLGEGVIAGRSRTSELWTCDGGMSRGAAAPTSWLSWHRAARHCPNLLLGLAPTGPRPATEPQAGRATAISSGPLVPTLGSIDRPRHRRGLDTGRCIKARVVLLRICPIRVGLVLLLLREARLLCRHRRVLSSCHPCAEPSTFQQMPSTSELLRAAIVSRKRTPSRVRAACQLFWWSGLDARHGVDVDGLRLPRLGDVRFSLAHQLPECGWAPIRELTAFWTLLCPVRSTFPGNRKRIGARL